MLSDGPSPARTGFEIDNCGGLFSGDGDTATPSCTGRNIVACQPIAKGDDWAQGASFHGIFNGNGLPNIDPGSGDPYRASLFVDPNWGNSSPTGGVDPTQFGGVSNKNIDEIGDPLIDPDQDPWDWNGVGGGPQKNDITNTYIYTKIAPGTGDRWFYVACETRATNGDSRTLKSTWRA